MKTTTVLGPVGVVTLVYKYAWG